MEKGNVNVELRSVLEQILILKRSALTRRGFMFMVAEWFNDQQLNKDDKAVLYHNLYVSRQTHNLFDLGEMLDLWNLCEMDKISMPHQVPSYVPRSSPSSHH